MKKNYLKIVSPVIFLLSLISIFIFKTVPSSKIWKNYSVLYVPVEADDKQVINVLNSCGISDITSLSGQFLPVSLSENSVEISMFKINREKPEYSYYLDRNAYFYDKSKNFRLYYIPQEFKNQLYDSLALLTKNNIQAGIDATASYPWAIPVVVLSLIIILTLFCKKKVLFFISSSITILFLYSNPYYTGALSSILIVLSLFFIINLWRREGVLNCLLNKMFAPVMMIFSILSAFSVSFKTGLFLLVTIISIAAFIVTYALFEDYLFSKNVFNPVYILPAKKVSIFAKKSNIVMPASIIAALIITGVFFLTSSQSINSHLSKLLLPSSAREKSENLPQMEDYYKWIWNIKAFPYTSLNQNNTDYLIKYPRYNNDSGFISETKNIMVYNQNFKDNVLDEIDSLPFNSIEKVIKSEGKEFNAGYSSSNSTSVNLFSVIMMIICFFVLLFIYFYTIIKKEI